MSLRNVLGRLRRELRAAWRTFWWQAVAHGDKSFSRWQWAKFVVGHLRIALFGYGPPEPPPPPLTPEQEREVQKYLPTRPPTDEEMELALQIARDRGWLKGDKWVWG